MSMWDALRKVEERFKEIEDLLGTPAVASDPRRLRDLSKERAQLERTVRAIADFRRTEKTIADDEAAVASGDAELAELAQAELAELKPRLEQLEGELRTLLLPRDPDDDRNVIVEIRAGVGGEEAALFAANLYRMYSKYAEKKGWKQEI